jgi:hypothetical protein
MKPNVKSPAGRRGSQNLRRDKQFFNRPRQFNGKFDEFLLKKIAGQDLGFISELAGRIANRLDSERWSV